MVRIPGPQEHEIREDADAFEASIVGALHDTVRHAAAGVTGIPSPDDLGPMRTTWQAHVQTLMPVIERAYRQAVTDQRRRQREALINVLASREGVVVASGPPSGMVRSGVTRQALYSEDQPRDDHGRWGDGGGDSSSTADTVSRLAADRVATAKAAEPELTKLCQDTVSAYDHGHLEGLDFRLKGQASLERKIKSQVDEGRGTPDEVASKMYDINRYTGVYTPNEYAASTQSALDDLRASGHTLNVKNYWNVPLEKNPYQGINVQGIHPDGTKYELQFHTQTSLDVKEGEMHKVYEAQRVESDPVKIAAYTQQMIGIAQNIPVPPGVGGVH